MTISLPFSDSRHLSSILRYHLKADNVNVGQESNNIHCLTGSMTGIFLKLSLDWTAQLNHHHRHFWQAPLRVRSAERRHQSPERTVLSQVNCFVHIKVAGFQILLNGFHPCNMRTSQHVSAKWLLLSFLLVPLLQCVIILGL